MNSFLTNLASIGWRVSVVIVLVALLRPWLRRGIGSRGVALLWSVLAVRLLWPGLPESRWGLIRGALDRQAAEVVRIVPRSAAETNAGQQVAFPEAPPQSRVLTNTPVPVRRMTTLEWVASLWAAGFCVVTAYFLWHLLAARRCAARTRPADAYPRLAEAFATLPVRLRGNLELRVTRELGTPVLAGWLHPQIWVPTPWVDRLSHEEWRHVLWHEIGHARRRDLPVQWLFAAACCLHWFNPLVWMLARWARDERELACDAWVIAQQSEPAGFTAAYGRTLLRLVESVCRRGRWPLEPGAVAMAASLGHLRRRLREIAAFRPVPTWRGSVGALAGAAALTALTTVGAVSSAQEPATPPIAATATPSVAQAGTITGRVVAEKTGEPLADVLVRAAVGKDVDMRHTRGPGSSCIEARTDRNGEYRLSVPLPKGEQEIKLDALAPGYRSSAGTLASGGDWASVTLAPGGTGKYDFKLSEALYLKGVVVDEAGQPVRDADIETTFSMQNGYGYVAQTRTAADGGFEVFDFPLQLEEDWKAGRLTANRRDYIAATIANVYSLSKEEQVHLKLVLPRGRQLTGTLFDAAGKPAPTVEVTAHPIHGGATKGSVTDRDGKFALRGLVADTDYQVVAHSLPLKEKYKATLHTDGDHDGLMLHLTPVVLAQRLQPTEVLGMQFVDLTDELRGVYDYDAHTKGALLLDPGKDSARLRIGELQEGQVFWLVGGDGYEGPTRVASVREFVDALARDLRRNDDGTATCRVVYTVNPWWTSTQHLHMTEREVADLKALTTASAVSSAQETSTPASPPPAPSPAASAVPTPPTTLEDAWEEFTKIDAEVTQFDLAAQQKKPVEDEQEKQKSMAEFFALRDRYHEACAQFVRLAPKEDSRRPRVLLLFTGSDKKATPVEHNAVIDDILATPTAPSEVQVRALLLRENTAATTAKITEYLAMHPQEPRRRELESKAARIRADDSSSSPAPPEPPATSPSPDADPAHGPKGGGAENPPPS